MRLSKLFFKISIKFWLSPFFPCFCLLYWSHLTLFRKEQYHMTTTTISKKKTRRPRRILFILLPILLILVLSFSILFFFSHQNLLFRIQNDLAATFHKRSLPQTVSVSTYTVQLDDLLSDPNCTKNQALMLINDAYPLSDSFQPEISYYKDTDVQMNSCIQDAYAAMSAAVREQFDVPLYVREAYRTAKEQEEKTEENSAVAAEIGASEHQAGLALDLYVPQFGGWAFTKSAAGRFVDTNCRDYGFIVRYPSYGEKQTGIPYEPWHLRYVGLPHSQIIMDEYLTLEEYIDLFELDSFYQYGSYLISHQSSPVVDAPSGWKHVTVSEDNLGGYLFTWEL